MNPLDIWVLLKIAGFGIVVALTVSVLKQLGRDDHGQLVTVTGVLLVLTLVAAQIAKFFSVIATTFGM